MPTVCSMAIFLPVGYKCMALFISLTSWSIARVISALLKSLLPLLFQQLQRILGKGLSG